MINSGDRILIDFDGVIAVANKSDGKPFYPDFGPPLIGIKDFLQKCQDKNIFVEIWSARTNYDSSYPSETQGHNSMMQIHAYMQKHELKYNSILMKHKPIGSHPGAAKWFLDDRTLNFKDGSEYSKFLFGE